MLVRNAFAIRTVAANAHFSVKLCARAIRAKRGPRGQSHEVNEEQVNCSAKAN
jgi:hypothetical protein